MAAQHRHGCSKAVADNLGVLFVRKACARSSDNADVASLALRYCGMRGVCVLMLRITARTHSKTPAVRGIVACASPSRKTRLNIQISSGNGGLSCYDLLPARSTARDLQIILPAGNSSTLVADQALLAAIADRLTAFWRYTMVLPV